MKKQKKELLAVILMIMLGVLSLLFLSYRAEQYGKTHPTKDYSYYKYEVDHK